MTDATRERIAKCTQFIQRFTALYESFNERVQAAEATLFHLGYTQWLEPEQITDSMAAALDRLRRLSFVRRMARVHVVRLERERQALYFGEDDMEIGKNEYGQQQDQYEQQHNDYEQRENYTQYDKGEQYGEAAEYGDAVMDDVRTDGGTSENSLESLGNSSSNGHGGTSWGTFYHAVFGDAV